MPNDNIRDILPGLGYGLTVPYQQQVQNYLAVYLTY